jgi:anti-sigma B factor antagonist
MLETLHPWLDRLQAGGVPLEWMRLCLDEALVNAVMHGSNYDPAKQVRASAYVSGQKLSFLIEDEGPGFKEEDLPCLDDPELNENGRGIVLIRGLMNEVGYWRNGASLLMAHFLPGSGPKEQKGEVMTTPPVPSPEKDSAQKPPPKGPAPFQTAGSIQASHSHSGKARLHTIVQKDQIAIVTILESHILDDTNINDVGMQLMDLVKKQYMIKMIIDMVEVKYLSSAVLRHFIAVFKAIRAEKGDLKLCRIRPEVREVFKITQLDKMIEIKDDIESAVSSFQKKSWGFLQR